MWKLAERVYEQPGIIKKRLRIVIAVVILLIMLAGALFLYYHNPEGGLILACPIRSVTGYLCPGCGAGRACYALLHGRLYQAFRYNPFLIIMMPWLALYYIVCGLQWVIYGKERLSIHIPEWIPFLLLVLFLIYGVVRNIEVYPFTLLAPTAV